MSLQQKLKSYKSEPWLEYYIVGPLRTARIGLSGVEEMTSISTLVPSQPQPGTGTIWILHPEKTVASEAFNRIQSKILVQ